MAKYKTAHEAITSLRAMGYTYQQLSEWSGLATSTLYAIVQKPEYRESAETRVLLTKTKPAEKPKARRK